MRDVLAALLRMRGYTHDDSDVDDMYWSGPDLGVRPMLECVAYEMNRDIPNDPSVAPGFTTYEVTVVSRRSYKDH